MCANPLSLSSAIRHEDVIRTIYILFVNTFFIFVVSMETTRLHSTVYFSGDYNIKHNYRL